MKRGIQKKRQLGTIPTVLDKLCMVANINSRKLNVVLKSELIQRDDRIKSIQNKLAALEERTAANGERLKTVLPNS